MKGLRENSVAEALWETVAELVVKPSTEAFIVALFFAVLTAYTTPLIPSSPIIYLIA